MPWCSQTNAIFAKSQNFTRIKDALIIDKAFKYAEYWPSDLGNFENCFEKKEKIKGNAFVNIAIYSFLPYIMTLKNKGHLCKSTKSYKGQEFPNHNAAKAQNFQWSRMPKSQTKLSNIQTVTFKMLVTSHHTKLFWEKEKKVDWTCFFTDCNLAMPKSQCCNITEFWEDQNA